MAGTRYVGEHLLLRATGAPVALRLGGAPDLPGPLAHHNSLPASAFDLPADRFGAAANLIDVVHAAIARMTKRPQSVISPVGSVVYARRDGRLLWPLVHDLDVWCYVPAHHLDGRSLHRWHLLLQEHVYEELRDRGVRTRLTWANKYVNLVDADGSLRMIELKLAHEQWLTEGLARIHHRFCGLRARRGMAFSLRPRLEWAAYSAFENHYPAPASRESFTRLVADIPPQAAMTGLQFVYHENLAAAMRRFGPAHVLESHLSDARLQRNGRGVWKKVLMLAVMRRDERLKRTALARLLAPAIGGRPSSRSDAVRSLIENLDALSTVDSRDLAAWLTPVDPNPLPLQVSEFREQPLPAHEFGGTALFDDATR